MADISQLPKQGNISNFIVYFNPNLGIPKPSIRWLKDGIKVDDQIENSSGDIIENRLLWPSVTRADLNSIFTCQAMNTMLVEPKETSFVLDMHCECLFISLDHPKNFLTSLH